MSTTLKRWQEAQKWEADWHGNCINSFHEEEKQLVYAEKMGLIKTPTPKTPHNFDLEGKSVLDIGGGAYSLLLKCVNYHENTMVTDPLMDKHPEWVKMRYKEAKIWANNRAGEDIINWKPVRAYDEVWIYNVLEHVIDPKKLLENALGLSKVVRIFEWLDTRENVGHPHTLKENELNAWLGGEGKVENIRRGGAVGKAYYGVFKGKHYEEVTLGD